MQRNEEDKERVRNRGSEGGATKEREIERECERKKREGRIE